MEGPDRRIGAAAAAIALAALCVSPGGAFQGSDRPALSEDSLQTLVVLEPDTPSHWFDLGKLAARKKDHDLAEAYFSEASRLAAGRPGRMALEIGGAWLGTGEAARALPYLLPNLALLSEKELEDFQQALEKSGHTGIRLVALRHLAERSRAFSPAARRAAAAACGGGELIVCRDILEAHLTRLDASGLAWLLRAKLYLNEKLDPGALDGLVEKQGSGELGALVHVHCALGGRWKDVGRFLSRASDEGGSRAMTDLLRGMEAASRDRHDAAAGHFKAAIERADDSLGAVAAAELYRLFAVTGEGYKLEQFWEEMKETFKEPGPCELLALQLETRGYEKQARYFYRVVLRLRPGSPLALARIWSEYLYEGRIPELRAEVDSLLVRDAFSCEGNTLAMRLHAETREYDALVHFARNASLYCFEPREPYYHLGQAYLKLNRPDQARRSFARFVKSGGAREKVPVYMR